MKVSRWFFYTVSGVASERSGAVRHSLEKIETRLKCMRVKQEGSTSSEYLVVAFVFLFVLLVAFQALTQIRAYHDRASQAMEIPL